MSSCSLGELAELVGGQLDGDANLEISGANTIREACGGEITLADDPKYAEALASSEAVAVVTNASFQPSTHPFIVVSDVHAAFAKIVARFLPMPASYESGAHPTAVVDPSAEIHPSAHIGARAAIGPNVRIDADSVIHAGAVLLAGVQVGEGSSIGANAVLQERTLVGKRVIIHAGAVLGANGFGYESSSGRHVLSPQLGNVVIHDDVEIGANSTIDRGTYGSTVIGEGTKVDNLVMVAHNCRIGKHNILCSQVGIAGSTVTGDYVIMAGQVGVRDHVDIGDGVRIGAKAGVKGDIPAGETYLGIPATPERQQMQLMIGMQRLPELRKQVRAIQRRLDASDRQGADSSDKEAA